MPHPLPRFGEIDGRRHLWRDLLTPRQPQVQPRPEQPTLFELHEDYRPAGERSSVPFGLSLNALHLNRHMTRWQNGHCVD